MFDDPIEQIGGSHTVKRADRIRIADAQRHQIPDLVLLGFAVDLVGDEEHRCVDSANEVCDQLIVRSRADRGVDDHEHHIGIGDGTFALARHLRVEGIAITIGHPAAGVDEQELAAKPLGDHFLAVTGDSGAFLDDGLAAAEYPVDECRLADVRAADDGDGWKTHEGKSAFRNATPSVSITSTGRGRSAGVSPSRNMPRLRHTSGRKYRWPCG